MSVSELSQDINLGSNFIHNLKLKPESSTAAASFVMGSVWRDTTTNQIKYKTAQGDHTVLLMNPAGRVLMGTSVDNGVDRLQVSGSFSVRDQSTNNVNFVVNSLGNSGFGTNNPLAKVSIVGGGISINGYSIPASGQSLEMGYLSTYSQINSYNRTSGVFTQLRLDGLTTIINSGSGGNVGIGLVNPDRTLTLAASGSIGWSYSNAGLSYHTITAGGIDPMAFKVAAFTQDIPVYTFSGNATNPLMTILNGGGVGIGSTDLTGISVRMSKNMTGTSNAYGLLIDGTVENDVTINAFNVFSRLNTKASPFTIMGAFNHFTAALGTVGAGSVITNQIGFRATNLTGATSNYGFWGDLSSGAGKWNLYMDGTANNYLAGSLGIGTTSLTGVNLSVSKNITGAVNSQNILSQGTVQSGVTNSAKYFSAISSTQATAFTLPNLVLYEAAQGNIGAGSTVTSQFGFWVRESLIGATNNYGFRGAIPSGTNRWNLYMDGTADNYLAGSLGIGTTSLNGVNLRISKNITGATASYGIEHNGVIQSDVTSSVRMYRSIPQMAAGSYTLGVLAHFGAHQSTIGVGATLSNQYGFLADASLVGATNNYGFRGAIPSGTGRWNLFMDGTAGNYLAGRTLLGSVLDNGVDLLQVNGITKSTVYKVGIDSSDLNRGVISFHTNNHKTTERYFNGLYHDNGSGVVNLSSSHALHFEFSNNPSYPFRIYSKSWNTSTSSYDYTERFRVDGSNGNVGIGVIPNTGAILQAKGYVDVFNTTNTLLRLNNDGSKSTIQSFITGAASALSLNPDGGNVAIGMGGSLPVAKLQIYMKSGDGQVLFGYANTSATYIDQDTFQVRTATGVNKLNINNNLFQSFASQHIFYLYPYLGTNGFLRFQGNTGGPTPYIEWINGSGNRIGYIGNSNSAMQFTTEIGNTLFTGSSRVLFGTGIDNGVSKIQVFGDSLITGTLTLRDIVVNATLPQISFQRSGTIKSFIGITAAANNFINGSLVDELIFRTQGTGMVYSVDSGSTIAMKLSSTGNLVLGAASPDSSAILDLTSTSRGFLPPRMTSAQRVAISSPVEGLMVYQTDGTKGWYGYNGTTWVILN